MEKYYVEINNEEYEVIVRKESKSKSSSVTNAQNNNPDIKSNIADPESLENKNTSNGQNENAVEEGDYEPVTSPMSGTILSLNVSEGDIVTKDQVVITIEAMKMETEIVAPVKGEIVNMIGKVGNNCKQGETLALIKEIGGQ